MFVFGPRLLIPLFYISTKVDDNYAHLGLKNALIQGPFLFYRERRGEKKNQESLDICLPAMCSWRGLHSSRKYIHKKAVFLWFENCPVLCEDLVQ